ncbi:MAG: hypothetical protein INH37_27715 [Myxococcaceae bacterium]|nr:hypothetical protein [Myxococcaceae bacterium]
MRALLPTLVAALVSTEALASSQGDWFASLYTGDGIELRNDERVFALFAIFNAMGFDQGPVTRSNPIPKVVYHPVRQAVRGRVIGGDVDVRKAADAFFDAHQVPLQRYLSYVVGTSQPPFGSGAKAKELQDLKGLEVVLQRAWTGWKLDELMGQVQGDYRKALKGYLSVLDGPLARARATLKTPEAQEALLVVNLLDAQDSVRAVLGENGEAFLIVGPSEKPNVEGLVREFARLSIEPQVAKKIAGWGGGAQVLREAQLAGVADQSVQEYATSLLTLAVALRAMDAPDAAWEAATARGYFGLKAVAKLFDDGKPVETWLLDAMQRVETSRPGPKK